MVDQNEQTTKQVYILVFLLLYFKEHFGNWIKFRVTPNVQLHLELDSTVEVIVNNRFFLQNISVENTLSKGVIRGCPSCSNCQKVIACWPPEEGCRPLIDYTTVFHPTEEVLSGHNFEAKVLGSGFPLPSLDDHNDDQSKYRKSGWNLNNTPKMPGSLLAFDSENFTLSTPRMDVGMCFSSLCWVAFLVDLYGNGSFPVERISRIKIAKHKVEEHHLYLLSYMHLGSSRIWYGAPSKYHLKCEALLKKTLPELPRNRELFHKLRRLSSGCLAEGHFFPIPKKTTNFAANVQRN
ncbi:transcription factor jumonji (jmj) family protein / zinc finger (C5HC2 type) family protein [Artemisia annua]|uniref:Transcription factor jumonji (Jmj) family protein / zinc finger (C5HC2 type) family protein n=1 Tax=Artemisia annua TaxID=35608 RepID=A0A2U1MR96_ARTAN|nr:transcription factor jumonji (jmj) family protein / zinc finger (C5HC2 type) family protein [Artemisia annua]